MDLDHISFTPVAAVKFTENEIAVLLQCSASHYDGRCKDAGQPGGFLFGIKNRCAFSPGVPISIEWRDLGTLAKIAEVGAYLSPKKIKVAAKIRDEIGKILKEMNESRPSSRVYPQNTELTHPETKP